VADRGDAYLKHSSFYYYFFFFFFLFLLFNIYCERDVHNNIYADVGWFSESVER
jgi:hypothetical protein